eukprot:scaffold198267_cov39-Attheya_sp.AAC.1
MQTRLYRSFTRQHGNSKTFLEKYHMLRPVHNHPACLLIQHLSDDELSSLDLHNGCAFSRKSALPLKSISERESAPEIAAAQSKDASPIADIPDVDILPQKHDMPEILGAQSGFGSNAAASTSSTPISPSTSERHWWDSVAAKWGRDRLFDVKSGRKFILLLQILALADMAGDKVLVFSQCKYCVLFPSLKDNDGLKTLNYIEKVLNTPNWENLVPGLTSLSPGR